MGQFSNSFPKHFSYLCEYAFRFDLSCSFCEYPFIFHWLHCSPSFLILILFSLHTSGLGYPGLTIFLQTKGFHLQKQAAGNPTAAASSRRDKNTVLKPL